MEDLLAGPVKELVRVLNEDKDKTRLQGAWKRYNKKKREEEQAARSAARRANLQSKAKEKR